MNLQTFNLKNSSVLNEEELMVLLGGGFDENEVINMNCWNIVLKIIVGDFSIYNLTQSYS